MKRLILFFTPLVILVVIAAFWWQNAIRAPGRETQEGRFIITKGTSAAQIGNDLEKKGLIKSALAFKFYTQITGSAKKIQAGQYTLSPDQSLVAVVNQLLKGPEEFWITIPEGLRREEIVTRFIQGFELSGSAAEGFKDEFLSLSQGREGELFPDTYLFPPDAAAKLVVDALLTTQERLAADLFNQAAGRGLNQNEVLILASLLERETLTDVERPIVAGILIKRWRAGWPLQVDATVQYALASQRCGVNLNCDWWPRPLTRDDLEINSAYNTYRFAGLPPAPIANPGLSSLEAVANFEESTYWYYIHDSEGQIHYAATLEEHNANIARYLK